jgi:hypothetical protein
MRIIEHESTLRCQYSNFSDFFGQRVENDALQLGVLGGSASPIEHSPWRKAMPKPSPEAQAVRAKLLDLRTGIETSRSGQCIAIFSDLVHAGIDLATQASPAIAAELARQVQTSPGARRRR